MVFRGFKSQKLWRERHTPIASRITEAPGYRRFCWYDIREPHQKTLSLLLPEYGVSGAYCFLKGRNKVPPLNRKDFWDAQLSDDADKRRVV